MRHDYGTRFWGQAGPVEFSLGGLYQGEFRYARSTRTRDVSAYAINPVVGYRFTDIATHPLLALQSDLYSGGNASRSSTPRRIRRPRT